jgi:hypothetical protein
METVCIYEMLPSTNQSTWQFNPKEHHQNNQNLFLTKHELRNELSNAVIFFECIRGLQEVYIFNVRELLDLRDLKC